MPITKGDFYELGLTGHENSAKLRDRLAKEFALPSGMNANGLCSCLLYTSVFLYDSQISFVFVYLNFFFVAVKILV